jgi:hypothetical protein
LGNRQAKKPSVLADPKISTNETKTDLREGFKLLRSWHVCTQASSWGIKKNNNQNHFGGSICPMGPRP